MANFFNIFYPQEPEKSPVIDHWLAGCRQPCITRPEVRFNLTWASK